MHFFAAIADKLDYVRVKVFAHATSSTKQSGVIRTELKVYGIKLSDTEASLEITKNNLGEMGIPNLPYNWWKWLRKTWKDHTPN